MFSSFFREIRIWFPNPDFTLHCVSHFRIATGKGDTVTSSQGWEKCKRGYLRIKQKGFPKSKWPLLVSYLKLDIKILLAVFCIQFILIPWENFRIDPWDRSHIFAGFMINKKNITTPRSSNQVIRGVTWKYKIMEFTQCSDFSTLYYLILVALQLCHFSAYYLTYLSTSLFC